MVVSWKPTFESVSEDGTVEVVSLPTAVASTPTRKIDSHRGRTPYPTVRVARPFGSLLGNVSNVSIDVTPPLGNAFLIGTPPLGNVCPFVRRYSRF